MNHGIKASVQELILLIPWYKEVKPSKELICLIAVILLVPDFLFHELNLYDVTFFLKYLNHLYPLKYMR